MIFSKGNGIKCSQDHYRIWHKEIPDGIDFKVEKNDFGIFQLTADGYGIISCDHKTYGSGPLFPHYLTEEQRQLLLTPEKPTRFPEKVIQTLEHLVTDSKDIPPEFKDPLIKDFWNLL